MIKAVTYASRHKGPRLLIFGAVHGNEICGPAAIRRVLAELEEGKLHVTRGQVTFVPVCNPRAYEKNVRFTESNLNRNLMIREKPRTYEEELGNILCPLLDSCDVFLDIHSYTAGGAPFACVSGRTKEEDAFAAALGAYALVGDWEAGYKNSNQAGLDPREGVGTTEYARQHGAIAALLECGQHLDPQAPEIAYRAIHKALHHVGLTDTASKLPPTPEAKSISVAKVVFRTDDGKFAEPWPNFAPIKSGQVVATRANGEKLAAPADGYVVLPNPNVTLGAEWFYFGVDKAG